jgi:hypothetical protein
LRKREELRVIRIKRRVGIGEFGRVIRREEIKGR